MPPTYLRRSLTQIELAPLMASARSLQVKGLCSAGPGGTGSNPASGLNIIDPPAISLPPPTPILHTQATHPTVPTGVLIIIFFPFKFPFNISYCKDFMI